jgi:hypothetical protein
MILFNRKNVSRLALVFSVLELVEWGGVVGEKEVSAPSLASETNR